jgi:hypothetical protein
LYIGYELLIHLTFFFLSLEKANAFKKALRNQDDFIPLPDCEDVFDRGKASFLPTATAATELKFSLLLDPSTPISNILSHFGRGIIGSKLVLIHHTIHVLRFALFGSSVQWMYMSLGLRGNRESALDFYYPKEASLTPKSAMKLLKT